LGFFFRWCFDHGTGFFWFLVDRLTPSLFNSSCLSFFFLFFLFFDHFVVRLPSYPWTDHLPPFFSQSGRPSPWSFLHAVYPCVFLFDALSITMLLTIFSLPFVLRWNGWSDKNVSVSRFRFFFPPRAFVEPFPWSSLLPAVQNPFFTGFFFWQFLSLSCGSHPPSPPFSGRFLFVGVPPPLFRFTATNRATFFLALFSLLFPHQVPPCPKPCPGCLAIISVSPRLVFPCQIFPFVPLDPPPPNKILFSCRRFPLLRRSFLFNSATCDSLGQTLFQVNSLMPPGL